MSYYARSALMLCIICSIVLIPSVSNILTDAFPAKASVVRGWMLKGGDLLREMLQEALKTLRQLAPHAALIAIELVTCACACEWYLWIARGRHWVWLLAGLICLLGGQYDLIAAALWLFFIPHTVFHMLHERLRAKFKRLFPPTEKQRKHPSGIRKKRDPLTNEGLGPPSQLNVAQPSSFPQITGQSLEKDSTQLGNS
jgi:hypothetical protein